MSAILPITLQNPSDLLVQNSCYHVHLDSVIKTFQDKYKYTIDLDKAYVDNHFTDPRQPTVDAANYLDLKNQGPKVEAPLKITLRQGFEYFIKTINHRIAEQEHDPSLASLEDRKKCILGMHAPNSIVYKALTNLEIKNPPNDFRSLTSYGYVSWLDAICSHLENEGCIRSAQRLATRLIIYA